MPALYISSEKAKSILSWPDAVDALRQEHRLPKPEMHDLLFGPDAPSKPMHYVINLLPCLFQYKQ